MGFTVQFLSFNMVLRMFMVTINVLMALKNLLYDHIWSEYFVVCNLGATLTCEPSSHAHNIFFYTHAFKKQIC